MDMSPLSLHVKVVSSSPSSDYGLDPAPIIFWISATRPDLAAIQNGQPARILGRHDTKPGVKVPSLTMSINQMFMGGIGS